MKLPRDAPKVAGRTFIDLSSDISIAILQTVAAGWAQALKSSDVNADAGEVVMTERLREGMRTVSDELPWGGTMIVLDGMESRSRPEVLTPDGRTDISILWIEIFLRYREHVPHAIIECKRISGDDARLCREYVVNGIDRFRSGKYAANHAAGFMTGYLIAGAADEAARGVNRYLNAGRANREPRRDENLAPSTLVDEPWAWASRHPRAAAPAISVHHALLSFHGGRDDHGRALRRTSRMEFIGVDLAWDEGSDRKAANESGVVVLDATGKVVHAGWTRGVEETVAWVERNARGDALLFVDAPLVVNNESGRRLCEKQVGRRYGRAKVSANSTNIRSKRLGGVALRKRLETFGWRYSDGCKGPPRTGRHMSECYPYATIVGAPALGYDERPPYKCKPRSMRDMPASRFRERRAKVCDELIRRVTKLSSEDPPLDLSSHSETRALVERPSPVPDAEYKHREDLLDATLCAWTASVWVRWGKERCQMLGCDDSLLRNGLRATIIAPCKDEQRQSGRPEDRRSPETGR